MTPPPGMVGGDLVGVPGNGRLGHGGPGDPVLAGLVPVVLADQVGGNPIQPGPGIGVSEVIPVPFGEGGQEGLGEQVVGGLAASAPGKVAVDDRRVPVEQDREPLRLPPGTRDDRSIIHDRGFPGPPHARS
jgi:hypothetical protein